MKIYNKKYLFIGILASLVTACGSGGGGGGSSSSPAATPSKPTVNLSKPSADALAPVLPIMPPSNGNIENKEIVGKNKPQVEVKKDEVLKDKPAENVDEVVDPSIPPKLPEPPTKNNKTLTIDKESEAALFAFDGKETVNEKTGVINVTSERSAAMVSAGENSKAINEGTINGVQPNPNVSMLLMDGSYGGNLENRGTINGTGSSISAMSNRSYQSEGFNSVNNGKIELKGDGKSNLYYTSLIGMEGIKNIKDGYEEKDAILTNNGDIIIESNNFHLLNPTAISSMYLQGMSMRVNGKSTALNQLINNGYISVSGRHSAGMIAYGDNITLVNKGTIKTDGEDSEGMRAYGENTKVINEGKIDVSGPYSSGISVSEGAIGINEASGTITIDGQNAFAMSATNGSKVINKGKIILNGESIGMYAGSVGVDADKYKPSSLINEGEIIFGDTNPYKTAIWASGNATYVNKGKIIGNDGIEIKTEDKAKFIVGKEASGDVSRVRAKRSLKIDGDIVASKDLIEIDKKESIYRDVFSAPKIELARSLDSKPVSLFYNSKLEFNDNGNLNMSVYKNETTIEEFYEVKEFESLSESFDNYLDDDTIILSSDDKLVLEKIKKSDNIDEVKKIVKDLSGEIYANLPRQMFDIQDRFIKEDNKLIENLNEYNYNFNFFGDKSSVKDKGEISGYKTTSEGFVGTKKFENNIYATIGYENSSLKYNEGSKGSIQSIHTGVYKKLSSDTFDIKLGLNGEYNFHETNREIDSFDKKAKAKYNSYTLGANGEISKVYGDSLYIKPTLGLNLGYGKYEKFNEKNAGELGVTVQDKNYFSILPSVGFKIGKNFDFVDLYSNVIYSYELGDLNKKQDISLLGDKVKYNLNSDNLENENLVINGGISTEIKDFKVTFEIGKEFGKRENNYLALGIGYKF